MVLTTIRILLSVSCAAAIGLLLSSDLWANDYPEKPPVPADASWRLLSDNKPGLQDDPRLETGIIYWYEFLPDSPRDKVGDDQSEYEFEGEIYTNGRRLLDNDQPSPSWHTVVGWSPRNGSIFITFDLKKKYQITRLDIEVLCSDGVGSRIPSSAPQYILYSLNATDDWQDERNWKQVDEVDIGPEELPDWLISKFSPAQARFIRLEIASKPSRTMYLKEVRIWGIPADTVENSAK